jgi:hypothetical protein
MPVEVPQHAMPAPASEPVRQMSQPSYNNVTAAPAEQHHAAPANNAAAGTEAPGTETNAAPVANANNERRPRRRFHHRHRRSGNRGNRNDQPRKVIEGEDIYKKSDET